MNRNQIVILICVAIVVAAAGISAYLILNPPVSVESVSDEINGKMIDYGFHEISLSDSSLPATVKNSPKYIMRSYENYNGEQCAIIVYEGEPIIYGFFKSTVGDTVCRIFQLPMIWTGGTLGGAQVSEYEVKDSNITVMVCSPITESYTAPTVADYILTSD